VGRELTSLVTVGHDDCGGFPLDFLQPVLPVRDRGQESCGKDVIFTDLNEELVLLPHHAVSISGWNASHLGPHPTLIGHEVRSRERAAEPLFER